MLIRWFVACAFLAFGFWPFGFALEFLAAQAAVGFPFFVSLSFGNSFICYLQVLDVLILALGFGCGGDHRFPFVRELVSSLIR